MEDIQKRLEKELENIRYQTKIKENLLLTTQDVRNIFRILKENDMELKPMLEILEVLVSKLIKDDYLLAEAYIQDILKYYNIVGESDIVRCRHKFFFTENKKLTKKPFFCPATNKKIHDELEIENILKKL